MTTPRIPGIERATGRSWDEWLRFLDAAGAEGLDHPAIARRVQEELEGTVESAAWWAQSVTVAYEQHVGRRVPGQRADGTFEVSVSRSTSLGMVDLMAAWRTFAADDDVVRGLVVGEPRVSGTDRRMTWRAAAVGAGAVGSGAVNGGAVVVTSEPRTNGTASLVVRRTGLETPEARADAREQWVEVLERFVRRG